MTYHQIFVIPTKIKRGKQYHIVIFVLEVKATQNTFLIKPGIPTLNEFKGLFIHNIITSFNIFIHTCTQGI